MSDMTATTFRLMAKRLEEENTDLEAEVTRLREELAESKEEASDFERASWGKTPTSLVERHAKERDCLREENERLRMEMSPREALRHEIMLVLIGDNERLRAAIQAEIDGLTLVAESCVRSGLGASTERRKIARWQEVLGDAD